MPIILDFFKGGVKWNMTLNVRLIDKGGYYMKGFKKLTAGLMGVVMALGVCGFTALAEDKKVSDENSLQEAVNEAKDGDIIVLEENITTDTLVKGNTLSEINLTIDLNGHYLTYNAKNTISITNGGSLKLTDSSGKKGTLEFSKIGIAPENTASQTSIKPQSNSSLIVENINFECPNGSGFFPQGEDASVTIKNSNIEAKLFCIGTNAEGEENYGVNITIDDSNITALSDDGDNCAILMNVGGNLNIKNSEITGDRQALIARAGEVKVEDTTLEVTGKFVDKYVGGEASTLYHNEDWLSGNEVPTGALIVGSRNGNYNEKANVTVIDSEIISEDEEVPAIYTDANEVHTSKLEISGEDTLVDGAVMMAEDKKDKTQATITIYGGEFTDDYENIKGYIDTDSKHITDKNGNIIIMDKDTYENYLDDQRDSGRHSYSLKEGKTERDDEEEEPVVTPEPEEEEGPFSDVGKDNPNYDAIVEVYEKGWMVGIADGVFAPNGTLTRGMAVTILWNRAGQPEPASVAPFLDVTSDAWYAKAVAWAYENGITSGYGDTYGPDDFVTTEQFTRMNDIANGRTPEVYVGGAPNATRGWVAGLLVME